MRPETSILLSLEPLSAILARVAYRVIQIDARKNPGRYAVPSDGLGTLSRQLHAEGLTVLSTWVSAYAFHLCQGVSTQAYKQRVVRRARWARLNREGGKPWARVPPK